MDDSTRHPMTLESEFSMDQMKEIKTGRELIFPKDQLMVPPKKVPLFPILPKYQSISKAVASKIKKSTTKLSKIY